jgi:ankyrin repeat protein
MEKLKFKIMKTQKISAQGVFNSLRRSLYLGAIVLIAACSGSDNSKDASGDSTSAAQSQVKPPQIDINSAVVTDNIEAVKQHIAAGSNINEKDPFGGSSPLISASVFGKTEIAKVLIEGGADLDIQNNDGSTALHSAAFFCRPEIIDMLLDKGADKTIRNKFGATAYESVAAPFEDVKSAYDMMGTMLSPMGLKLDYDYIQKTRPEIAATLK